MALLREGQAADRRGREMLPAAQMGTNERTGQELRALRELQADPARTLVELVVRAFPRPLDPARTVQPVWPGRVVSSHNIHLLIFIIVVIVVPKQPIPIRVTVAVFPCGRAVATRPTRGRGIGRRRNGGSARSEGEVWGCEALRGRREAEAEDFREWREGDSVDGRGEREEKLGEDGENCQRMTRGYKQHQRDVLTSFDTCEPSFLAWTARRTSSREGTAAAAPGAPDLACSAYSSESVKMSVVYPAVVLAICQPSCRMTVQPSLSLGWEGAGVLLTVSVFDQHSDNSLLRVFCS